MVLGFLDAAAEQTADLAQQLEAEKQLLVTNPGGFFSDLWDGILSVLPSVAFALVTLIVGMLLTKLVIRCVRRAYKRSKADTIALKFIDSVVKIVLYVLLFTIVLTILGVPMTSLVAVIGTAGLAIGLALKDSLSNVASGMIILFSKPFKTGDMVTVNGNEGRVDSINIICTTLMTLDDVAIIVPNSQMANSMLINSTKRDLRRIAIKFSISYSDDFKTAQKVIIDELKNYPSIVEAPEPSVVMSAHAASSIEILVRAWCKSSDYPNAYYEVVEAVRYAFLKNDITIPFNQLEVKLLNK